MIFKSLCFLFFFRILATFNILNIRIVLFVGCYQWGILTESMACRDAMIVIITTVVLSPSWPDTYLCHKRPQIYLRFLLVLLLLNHDHFQYAMSPIRVSQSECHERFWGIIVQPSVCSGIRLVLILVVCIEFCMSLFFILSLHFSQWYGLSTHYYYGIFIFLFSIIPVWYDHLNLYFKDPSKTSWCDGLVRDS